jgi:hypothetical protein
VFAAPKACHQTFSQGGRTKKQFHCNGELESRQMAKSASKLSDVTLYGSCAAIGLFPFDFQNFQIDSQTNQM